MRLDKYLKMSRIIKRRTVAAQACAAGRVIVDGRAAKASYEVKVGDIMEISIGQRVLKIEVLSLEESPSKADAAAMYRQVQ